MHTTATSVPTSRLADELTATYGHLLPRSLIAGTVRSAASSPSSEGRSAELAARADVAALAEAVRRAPAGAGAW
jgi:hypothetical protein